MKRVLFILIAAALAVSCTSTGKKEKIEKQFDEISQLVKQEYAPDRREKTFEPSLAISDDAKTIVLKGSTTEPEAKEALLKKLIENKIEVLDSMKLLPDPALGDKTFGITAQSVINFRYGSGYSSESATQTIMGTPLRILEKKGGWTRAVTPEGYIAWVSSGSIQPMNEAEYSSWTSAPKLIVTTHYTLFRETPSETGAVVSDGVWGNIVKADGSAGNYNKVILPNGKVAYVLKAHTEDFSKWIASRNPSADNILATAVQFLGFPYMWGGTSVKAMDCSGFTKTAFYLNGVILERDASQQALTGEEVEITDGFENLQKGDLLFFGSKATPERKERITHVGIYIANGEFIHSATSVRINSLIPDSHNYYDGSNRLVRVKRLITKVDQDPGIVSIAKHQWYFN
jgi:cell wall-associated NlpC family hydrolase